MVPLEAASVATVVAEAADTAPPLPASVGGEQIGLEIVYDLNSSFLPPAGAQDLERLLARLRPDRRYELELVAAVNEQGVRGANATDARRYNRWLAERRLERLTGWLNREAVLSLEIRGRLVEGDSTRRVAVADAYDPSRLQLGVNDSGSLRQMPDELITVLVDRRKRHVSGGLERCIMDPQQNHAVASSPLVKNQRSEIGVVGDDDAFFGVGHIEDVDITPTLHAFHHPGHIVATIAQCMDEAAPQILVDQEPHAAFGASGSSRSPRTALAA